jgi:putative oxygen-independent coproporphyrinogen III oxidase
VTSIAIYIHWPFCKSKCPYCDFNSHVRETVAYDDWLAAYLHELDHFAPLLDGKTVQSIFFGGGTPSLMPPRIAAAIIDALARLCTLPSGTEITLEANPTSVEIENFRGFRAAGINRISLGIQSLSARDLQFLGRTHDVAEAMHAIDLARSIFDRYSFDLIYARPGQSVAAWEEELHQALALADDHLSLYQLTIEKGTAFYGAHLKGDFIMPDETLAAELYETTQHIMNAAGLPAYEISNHAKPGGECRHNLAYWHYDDYLGIGPGAHSRIDHKALMMLHSPEGWLKSVETHGHGIQQHTALSACEIKEEMLLMGMRLTKGISRECFLRHTGSTPEDILPSAALKRLTEHGLIALDADGMRALPSGLPVLNAIISQLVN